jgi:hypothetical protein
LQVVTSRKLLDNDQEEDVKPKVAQQYEQCAGENYDGPERCAGELECVKCARSVCTSVCVLQVLWYPLYLGASPCGQDRDQPVHTTLVADAESVACIGIS